MGKLHAAHDGHAFEVFGEQLLLPRKRMLLLAPQHKRLFHQIEFDRSLRRLALCPERMIADGNIDQAFSERLTRSLVRLVSQGEVERNRTLF